VIIPRYIIEDTDVSNTLAKTLVEEYKLAKPTLENKEIKQFNVDVYV
jgi:hypothetical protein